MTGPKHTDRRTVLKTLGAGVVGGIGLTGSASADHGSRGPISLEDLHFKPHEYTVHGLPAKVTWEHNDSGSGFIHNVALDHSSMKSRVKSRPLYNGDTYSVNFDSKTIAGKKVLVISDDDQRAVADFSGSTIDLHVHCDLHSPEMEMKRFTVTE